MAKQSFSPRSEQKKADWFSNFAQKIAGYAAKYNLSATEVADVIASEQYFAYWFNYMKLFKEYMLKVTAYKNEVRDGVPAGAEPSVPPTPLAAPLPPPATAPGGYARAIALGNSIKEKSNYTIADGQDLNLEGAEIILPPASTFKPVISVVAGNNGKPELKWKKQTGTSGIHIFKKVTGGSASPSPSPVPGPAASGYVYLGSDTQPDFTDNSPLPAAGVSEQRSYVAIYFVDDENVGQWSEEVKITVTGTI
ncbi:MAG: hypothetical protein AB7G44_10625 [Bacteroidia bacterium]